MHVHRPAARRRRVPTTDRPTTRGTDPTGRPDPSDDATRRLDVRLAEVSQARRALAEARARGADRERTRELCTALGASLDAAVAAAQGAVQAATGPVDGLPRTRLIAVRRRPAVVAAQRVADRLRTERQQHLLARTPACGPAHLDPGEVTAAVRGTVAATTWPASDHVVERLLYARKTLLAPRR
ncbi:hypothetical protein [Thalassiella azotivora]